MEEHRGEPKGTHVPEVTFRRIGSPGNAIGENVMPLKQGLAATPRTTHHPEAAADTHVSSRVYSEYGTTLSAVGAERLRGVLKDLIKNVRSRGAGALTA